jgi:hypothetical protein
VNGLRWLAAVAGLAIVVGTTSSVLRNLVVPRRLRSKLTRIIAKTVRAPFRLAASRTESYETRDAFLAWTAPLTIIVTLVVWLLLYMLGYGLLILAVSDLGVAAAIREAGSSVFTLGFASTDRTQLTFVDFAAAMTGPIVIGLQIGYLPALYSAYNRREAEVTMLDSRAGEPNWGPEILARHAGVSSLENLADLYRGWERWAADVSESHSNYPVLIYFRSQEATRNWLVGLLSVMDSAALTLAFNPGLNQGEPRMALRMGFVCLRDLADTINIPYDPDPDPDTPILLTYDDFLQGVARLERAGYPMHRTPEEAWPHFRGWRVNYEQIAYTLAYEIEAVPALWSGPRRGVEGAVQPLTPLNREPGGYVGPPSGWRKTGGEVDAPQPPSAEPDL